MLSHEDIDTYISQLGGSNELGDLRQSEDEDKRPWERKRPDSKLNKADIPDTVFITKANMLYISKSDAADSMLEYDNGVLSATTAFGKTVIGAKLTIITRPESDYKEKDKSAFEDMLDSIRSTGSGIIFKSNIHQKFAVIDQRIVWYGSINLLSFGSAEESIMRLDCINIANELIGTIEEIL